MNRSIAPSIVVPQSIKHIQPQISALPNTCPLYTIAVDTQDVMRFALIFEAGTRFQSQFFLASSTANLLNEGTALSTGEDIANKLDFYGASFEANVDNDWVILSVYCLCKHCDSVLAILSEFILTPSYPEKELSVYKNKKKQQLHIARQRVETIAQEEIAAKLFGRQHPYGYSAPIEAYDALHRELLLQYHQQYLTSARAFMLLAGKVSDKEQAIVAKYFGHQWGDTLVTQLDLPAIVSDNTLTHIPKADSVQAAIRLGKIMFPKTHPDFTGVMLLGTIFGGYFGSRLMQNIREEKGYTYGIYAGLSSKQHSGYLSIGTETGSNYCEAVFKEIAFEMARLQTDLVPQSELDLVKQFTYGEMMRTLDGPWGQAEVAIDIAQNKLSPDYVAQLFEEIKQLDAERLRQLAQTYLNFDDYAKVQVG